MITVVPHGGLCNRMRAVASAALLARQHGRPLRVRWYRTFDLNCAFGTLFDTRTLPFEVVEADATGMRATPTKLAWRLQPWLLPALGTAFTGRAQSARFLAQPDLLKPLLAAPRWVVHSHSKLADAPGLYAQWQPVAELAQVIAGHAPRLARAVGVHIRRSDNAKAIAHGPVQAFIAQMRQQAAQQPGCEFFVATDSPETYAQVQAEFGNAVFSHPKAALDRDDPRAIRDALVDLWALGHCRYLIGSYWSSFTDTAWELRGIPHTVVNQA